MKFQPLSILEVIKMNKIKSLLFIIFAIGSNGIIAESMHTPKPGMSFRTNLISPAILNAKIMWQKGDAAYPLDSGVWYQDDESHQWGIEYLVKAFGLEDYEPSKKSVLVAKGWEHIGPNNQYSESTHYIYHPSKEKVCIIHFIRRWAKSGSGNSHSSIDANLIGCHTIFSPR
jgi:hypothetical protein